VCPVQKEGGNATQSPSSFCLHSSIGIVLGHVPRDGTNRHLNVIRWSGTAGLTWLEFESVPPIAFCGILEPGRSHRERTRL